MHQNLAITEEAVDYVSMLIFRLLDMLCECQPHSVKDVEQKVDTFPDPIDDWVKNEAQGMLNKGKKNCTLVLPVDKMQHVLKVCNTKHNIVCLLNS